MDDQNARRNDDALALLAAFVQLGPDALHIAEGWSILPERAQRHVKILIDDYIASMSPELKRLYSNAALHDQLRFNRIIERAQQRDRGYPPTPDGEAT